MWFGRAGPAQNSKFLVLAANGVAAETIFKFLDYESAYALRSCCKQLRAAGYIYIKMFSVTVEERTAGAFREKLQTLAPTLRKFARIETLALVNVQEAHLGEAAAAVSVRALLPA